jgi:hypothetical protein
MLAMPGLSRRFAHNQLYWEECVLGYRFTPQRDKRTAGQQPFLAVHLPYRRQWWRSMRSYKVLFPSRCLDGKSTVLPKAKRLAA